MIQSLLAAVVRADQAFHDFLLEGPVWAVFGIFFLLGAVVGRFLADWIGCVTLDDGNSPRPGCCASCGRPARLRERIPLLGSILSSSRCRACGARTRWVLLVELGTALLFAAFVLAVAQLRCQEIPEGGSIDWIHWRIIYHLVLISLLIAATGIDFRLYIIPDSVTLTGIAVGLGGAILFGNLQLLPLWVDWNHPFADWQGPYIPEWIKQHDHLHGLAWSTAGLATGGAATWLVRALSSGLLGQQAMGFGDVVLMAMIGSFIGWQPVVFVLALAPLCGLVVGVLVLLVTGRTYVPFGPYLSAAALVVLLSWRWLWPPLRMVFGHWPTLLFLAGFACVILVGLLGLLRLYRMIPVR